MPPRGGPPQGPTQTSPTQTRTVGPRGAGDDQDQGQITVTQRAEPTIAPPADPLAMSPEVKERIGTDWDGTPASPRAGGETQRSYFPYYEERHGDFRFRMLPPFWFEQTRGLRDPTERVPLTGIPQTPDRESLYGLFYYQRRSLKLDADVLFPLFWHVRDEDNHTTVIGPVVHREAPGEHDNWLAPLFFQGGRKDGGYFHSPLLLTTTHWSTEKAFTLSGLYFRDRSGTDVDWGVAPFVFHGDNGDVEGNRRTYTLIPPLLYFQKERELEESQTTIIGPVVMESNPKRAIFDVGPLFFHIKGRPASGGIAEEHTTLFPFFHYGWTETGNSLFVIPGYLRRTTPTADTMLTPFYSHATTRKGSTSLDAAGPIIPLWFNYRDTDIGLHAWALAPFFYTSDSPVGHDWLTPLVGHFESYGVSKTTYVFPSITINTNYEGWSTNIYPFFFMGREKDASHTVVAPVFWDFANPKKRSTVVFPVYWRFADQSDDSVFQLAGNTLYMQKKVSGGTDWQFHVLPLFSYGEDPQGYFWNFLFGLAGYTRSGNVGKMRAFWIPIQVAGP